MAGQTTLGRHKIRNCYYTTGSDFLEISKCCANIAQNTTSDHENLKSDIRIRFIPIFQIHIYSCVYSMNLHQPWIPNRHLISPYISKKH
jgi:hypothetical protein